MKAKITATALLIAAALPLTANADPATDRAQHINAEPLAQVSGAAVDAAHQVGNTHIADNGSNAMANARLELLREQDKRTDFAMSEHDLDLARQATTG
ncbi:hypothetical protein LCL99_06270 [Halomonas denitrificans]|uniref:hypothetical protein n=1 Tax=Halomonas TaxID=2745 RepID=UPI001A8F6203|nr:MULTISPECIES: hypothetical protein [Halomonas]MED5294640.1 hypothetical protein [Pseudomonadota bacterium]MBN8412888.1 hypothetical protein [Halomonas litopenaei]MBY5929018.1 hypothetical protein [Halomonas sp. DP8Y7-3]MBY5968111.1 hypothetical protein [Halomonas denitrificans]MBY5983604.1 hypothetical protein [Halomonas sp. DP5Y7-2]